MRLFKKPLGISLSIQNKILVLSILSILVSTVIVGSISSFITAKILKDKISENNRQMAVQVSENLDYLMMEIEKSADILLENEHIQSLFQEEASGETDPIFIYETSKAIEKLFSKLIINKSEISYINLSTPSNQFALETGIGMGVFQDPVNIYRAKEGKVYQTLEKRDQTSFWEDEIQLKSEHSKKNRINYIRILKDSESSRLIGILMVGVSKEALSEKLISNIYPRHQNYFAIMDRDTPILVLCSNSEAQDDNGNSPYFYSGSIEKSKDSDELKIGSTKYLFSKNHSDYSGWDSVNMVPLRKVLTSVDSLKHLTTYLTIICICLATGFATILSKKITLPIKKLTFLVNRIEKGQWNTSYPIEEEGVNPTLKIKTSIDRLLGLKGSFRSILIKYFLAITMLPLVILTFTLYGASMKIVEKEVNYSMMQSMNYINKRLELSLESAEQSSKYLFSNQTIQEGLLNYQEMSFEEKVETQKDFQRIFLQEQSQKQNLAYVGIFSLEGTPLFSSLDVYYNKKNITDEAWFKLVKPTVGEAVITGTYRDNLGKDVFSVVRTINNVMQFTTNVGKPIGYLLISYYESLLESAYRKINFGEGGNFYITDYNRIIVSNKDKSLLGKRLDFEIWSKIPNGIDPVIKKIFGERYIIYNEDASYPGWKLIGILPYKELVSSNKNIFTYNLYILIVNFFIALFMAITFSSRLSLPLIELRDKMKQVEAGIFPESISINSRDEIEELAMSFNSMVKKLKELIEEVYQAEITRQKAEIRQKEAELNTLQAQINPHFLYNTLDTINWIAIDLFGVDNDISNTVTALSSLLRSTIAKGDMVVPVEKQLKEVEEYLFIQKMRYEDKFIAKWDIEEEIFQYKMLNMTIQPIVENAIVHGIEKIETDGQIVIKGWMDKKDIVFEISDNGGGISPDKLDEVRNRIDSDKDDILTGSIGLRNTHQRLKHYYGEKYGLKIDSVLGGWTRVTICAPAIEG